MTLRWGILVLLALAVVSVAVVLRAVDRGAEAAVEPAAAGCPDRAAFRGRVSTTTVRLVKARLLGHGAISLSVRRGSTSRLLQILSIRCAASADGRSASLLRARAAFTTLCGTVPRSNVALRGNATVSTIGARVLNFNTLSCGGAPTAQLIAAGDIAACGEDGDDATGEMVRESPGLVAPLGDNAYEDGSETDFRECYQPVWGHAKWRTRPVPGNHEYHTRDASGYFEYFGAVARPPRGYYSYNLGRWHLIALNSNCNAVGGCGPGSAQERWLRADLRRNRARCTLAYMHHPRFSSGAHHGNTDAMEPFWQALYDARADVVLAGHEHDYERFAPQTPKGVRAPSRGIRSFVVGTGGRGTRPKFDRPLRATEVRNSDTLGILRMTLRPGGYDWSFVPAPGHGSFSDRGSGTCH